MTTPQISVDTVGRYFDLAHVIPGRVRFRYRTQPPCMIDVETFRAFAGVGNVRLNPAAASVVLDFDPLQVTAAQLWQQLEHWWTASQDRCLTVPGSEQHFTATDDNEGGDSKAAVIVNGLSLALSYTLPGVWQMPLALVCAWPVWRDGVDDLRHNGLTSHVLEALAVAISVGRRDYKAANTTLFLLALGEYLEHSIERRSDDLLKHLLKPTSGEVWVERDGVEISIPSTEICCGDIVMVSTGSTIPVDGTIMDGLAQINEATMTGESLPVSRERGDRALSGTVIEEGQIRIYAEHVGDDAAVSRISHFVERSLQQKSATQLAASRLAETMVPGVLGLSVATWLFSGQWERVAAVLQADYSCALKLATPVAFKASMYQAGQRDMLIKGADTLEKLAGIDTVVFDKTGTLSTGDLQVTDAVTLSSGSFSAEELLYLAASVEEHSVHPLAMAVVSAARNLPDYDHFDHKEVEFVVAHGVASSIDGKRIVVGSRHFIEDDEKIVIDEESRQVIETLQAEGKTLLYIGFDHRLQGVIGLKDTVRGNAAVTVERLRQLGVRRLIMLSGDHKDRAAEIAEQIGLDAYHAELMPEDKAHIINELKAQGASIAFVGDGVNDAPALSGAEVGISMHHGADLARLASDITLLANDIGRVADAVALSKNTMRLVRSNYQMTIGINSAILLAAALGMITPVRASLLHNGSTIAILARAFANRR